MERTNININLLGSVTTNQIKAVLEPLAEGILSIKNADLFDSFVEQVIHEEGWIQLEEMSDVSVHQGFLDACKREGVSFTWSVEMDFSFHPELFVYNAEIGSAEKWDTVDGEIVLTIAESQNRDQVQRARDAEAFIAGNGFVHAGESTVVTSYRERAMVLAALRFWQRKHPVPYSETSEGHIELAYLALDPLDLEEIDTLCKRINA